MSEFLDLIVTIRLGHSFVSFGSEVGRLFPIMVARLVLLSGIPRAMEEEEKNSAIKRPEKRNVISLHLPSSLPV